MASFYDIMINPTGSGSTGPHIKPKNRDELPPTAGHNKLGSAARAAANRRAETFDTGVSPIDFYRHDSGSLKGE